MDVSSVVRCLCSNRHNVFDSASHICSFFASVASMPSDTAKYAKWPHDSKRSWSLIPRLLVDPMFCWSYRQIYKIVLEIKRPDRPSGNQNFEKSAIDVLHGSATASSNQRYAGSTGVNRGKIFPGRSFYSFWEGFSLHHTGGKNPLKVLMSNFANKLVVAAFPWPSQRAHYFRFLPLRVLKPTARSVPALRRLVSLKLEQLAARLNI